MADEKVYTTKEAGPLMYNEGFEDDNPLRDVPWPSSEADDIHVVVLDEEENDDTAPATPASTDPA